MAYVDHAFSISDEDIMMETSYAINNRPPVKEIALAVSLFIFGIVGILIGVFMTYNRISGDCIFNGFDELRDILCDTGSGTVYTYRRIAYYAYKGCKGFSFANIRPL